MTDTAPPAIVDASQCAHHYRDAVTACRRCGRGLCSACRDTGGPGATLCGFCLDAVRSDARVAQERRDSHVMMRRAGIAVRRDRGEPVILRGGPLRLTLPLVGSLLAAAAAGVGAAEIEVRSGLSAALSGVVLAAVVGLTVRLLFGGTSRAAGAYAALLALLAVTLGRWLAEASGSGLTDVLAAGDPRRYPVASAALTATLYAATAALAYRTAAGRRIA